MNVENINPSIEVLSPEVIDQIAAGEVVERPAHLIKELVENSIDAHSTEISIDFSSGGRFVKVTDNGLGISMNDLPKAFLRFATSKIKNADDLWRLSSFGFRGEALASISAVSKVTIFTSQSSEGVGFRISSNFGKLSNLESVSRSRGCTIIVEELFQNVPARLKFMKSEVAESSHIKQTLKSLALANPQIEFRILQGGKLLYYWPKAPLKHRIETILEVKSLFEGTASRGKIKAHSFFSDPHQVSRVSKNVWLFAQNRPIQDRSLQAAVMEAYRNLLMNGEFPYAVCFLETDPTEIDVNIHPTKSQVKFVNPQDAFRAVQASIRDVLVTAPWLSASQGVNISSDSKAGAFEKQNLLYPQQVNLEFEDDEFKRTQYREKKFHDTSLVFQNLNIGNQKNEISEQNKMSIKEEKASSLKESKESIENESFSEKNTNLTKVPFNTDNEDSIHEPPAETFEDKITFKNDRESFIKPLVRHWSLLQIIGQAGLTYLVCQNEKGLVLIDQHAAHERVMFERLMNSWNGKKITIQQFLFPLPLELSEEKVEAIRNRREDFLKLGIELEELGPTTVGVKSAPALIKNKVLVEEIERFATQLLEWGDADLMEKAIADICARMACHSALRAGQSLSVPEMQKLLEEMDEFPLSSFCPHGRPVSVHYTWPELEKDFGRRL